MEQDAKHLHIRGLPLGVPECKARELFLGEGDKSVSIASYSESWLLENSFLNAYVLIML